MTTQHIENKRIGKVIHHDLLFSAGSGGPLLFSGVPPCAAVQRPPQVRNMMYSHFIEVKRAVSFMEDSSSTERKSAEHPDSFVIAPPSAFLFGTAVKMRTDPSRAYRENFTIFRKPSMASIFDVKALLKERRQMSVKDVSYHFRIPEGLAE